MSKLTDTTAAKAFAALGNPTRLSVLRHLVQAAPVGATVGEIQRVTQVPASTLAHHLAALVGVGIVEQEKQGREIVNRVNFDRIGQLSSHLMENCCAGLAGENQDAAA